MYDLVPIAIIWCVLLAVWGWFKPRPLSPPMAPGALPLIGHAYLFIGDRKHIFKLIQDANHYSLEKGGVIEVRISLHKVYVVTDPDDSLVIANTCIDKPYFYDFTNKFLNNGLTTAKASTWKVHRKLLNPAFSQKVLNTYLNEINIQAQTFASKLAFEVGKEAFDIKPYVTDFILKIVCRTSLGLEHQDQALIDKDYKRLLEEILILYVERALRVWLHLSFLYKMSSLKRREDDLTKKLQDIVDSVILKRKSNIQASKNNNMKNDSTEKFESLLDKMLNLGNKQDSFTDGDIKDHMNNLVAAAYDTTASALKHILLMLGSYQDVQERVFIELQEVFGQRETYCTKDDLSKLVYLEAVIKETLRLYPVVPLIGRHVDIDVALKKYTLSAGSTCIIGLYGINRHPMWGANANEFRPERWLDPATLPDNPNAFAAFSIGKRNCIGKVYSMMVMKTVLACIIRSYRITSDISNLQFEYDIMVKAVAGDLIRLTLRS